MEEVLSLHVGQSAQDCADRLLLIARAELDILQRQVRAIGQSETASEHERRVGALFEVVTEGLQAQIAILERRSTTDIITQGRLKHLQLDIAAARAEFDSLK